MIPIILLAVAGVLSMFIGAFKWKKAALPVVVIAGVLALIGNFAPQNYSATLQYSGMIQFDAYAVNFSGVLIGITVLILILSRRYYHDVVEHLGDIYALFLFALVGGIIMVASANLVMFFVGIEILSIPLYILAASERNNLLSNEAGLKYFLLGSFITVFLLLGTVLVYGLTGSFQFSAISAYLAEQGEAIPVLLRLGILLILVAFVFKISAAPFHFWSPDVYQGSPAVIMVFMASVAKTAAFGGFLRFLTEAIQPVAANYAGLIGVLAAVTMTIGNLMALNQTDLKRLLAFSSVANAGYIMLGLLQPGDFSAAAVLYYLLVYSLANVLAVGVYLTVRETTGSDRIEGLRGLYQSNPWLAFALTMAMLSLAGIPPLAGFVGKYAIFADALQHGQVTLVVIAALNSAIGIYYYLRVLMTAFQNQPNDMPAVPHVLGYGAVLLICVLALLGLGIMPGQVLSLLP